MSDDISVIDGVFGKRYGEVLLVTVGESGPQATVYNTFPLNDCPAELWDALNEGHRGKERRRRRPAERTQVPADGQHRQATSRSAGTLHFRWP
jgi:hypothetical protein